MTLLKLLVSSNFFFEGGKLNIKIFPLSEEEALSAYGKEGFSDAYWATQEIVAYFWGYSQNSQRATTLECWESLEASLKKAASQEAARSALFVLKIHKDTKWEVQALQLDEYR